MRHLYGYLNANPLRARFLASNNLGMSTEHFRALGGFDVRYRWAAAEDRDFCDRWLRSGHAMIYDPGAVVRHMHCLDLRSFCRQHWHYGRGAFRFRHGCAKLAQGRVQFEKLSFYVKLLLTPLFQANPRFTAQLLALLALSQCTHGAGFAFEWMKHLIAENGTAESGAR
jgi:GT2 family glycosyltransferase